MNLFKIPQPSQFPKKIKVAIETPKGTSAKYEYNHEDGYFEYDRSLISAMTYPCNYGFIPSVMGKDGDPFDALVYNSIPIDRGVVVECNVLGCLLMIDEGKEDHKILTAPVSHVRDYTGLKDIDPLFLRISKNFFAHYKDLNDKKVKIIGWRDKEEALKLLQA